MASTATLQDVGKLPQKWNNLTSISRGPFNTTDVKYHAMLNMADFCNPRTSNGRVRVATLLEKAIQEFLVTYPGTLRATDPLRRSPELNPGAAYARATGSRRGINCHPSF